jgi:hypothetical protein
VKLTVHVTAEDIRLGVPSRCDICPVALAASRAAGRPVEVGEDWIDFADCKRIGHATALLWPARAFIANFDMNGTVEPFSFTVELKE